MKHQKASVSWQNDTVELSRKEQVVYGSTVKYVIKETNVEFKAQHGRRVEKRHHETSEIYQEDWSVP
jgi:hypothetical protein